MSATGSAGVALSLWSAKQRVVLAAFLTLGVIGLIAGYAGTSGTLRVSRQVVWLNVSGAALIVSGAGIVLFLTAGRRQIGRRRLGLFGDVAALDAPSESVAEEMAGTELVAAATMTKYHRADCPFVEGKAVVAAAVAAHQASGRHPCGVCLGDES
jgi:hypothetical protein